MKNKVNISEIDFLLFILGLSFSYIISNIVLLRLILLILINWVRMKVISLTNYKKTLKKVYAGIIISSKIKKNNGKN